MKLRKVITITAACLLSNGMAMAAAHIWEDPGGWSSGVVAYDSTSAPKYSANELSLDLSASYIAGEGEFHDILKTNIRGNRGNWGGNVGLNYFLTPNIGIGGDINLSSSGEALSQGLGSVIFRIPLGGLAPYALVGGGRSLDPSWEWLAHAGIGLEYRINPVLGLFSDARFIWAEHSDNRLLIRAGLRVAL
jgi:hypothetical protein